MSGCSFYGQGNLSQAENREEHTEEPVSYEERQEELSAIHEQRESGDELDESQEVNEEVDGNYFLEAEFFNETITVDGQAVIQNPENVMVFVNHDFALPAEYAPEELAIPDVAFPFDGDLEKKYLRPEAAEALEHLFQAAEADGMELFAISGYRSYDRQVAIYDNAINTHGEDQAVSAIPGHSEHQTGLAMDVSSRSNDFALTEAFEDTAEGQWLADNAHEHGFIIRYPKGKEEITGYDFELGTFALWARTSPKLFTKMS